MGRRLIHHHPCRRQAGTLGQERILALKVKEPIGIQPCPLGQVSKTASFARSSTFRPPVTLDQIGIILMSKSLSPHELARQAAWIARKLQATRRVTGDLHGKRNIPLRMWNDLEVDEGGILTVGQRVASNGRGKITVRQGGSLVLGDDLFLGEGTRLVCRESIAIGSRVLFGPNAAVYDHDHDILSEARRTTFITRPVRIGDDAWIGIGAVVLKGVHIGERAVIGANAVVTKDVPANCIAVGNPATVVRRI